MQIERIIVTRNKNYTSTLPNTHIFFDEGEGKKRTLKHAIESVDGEWIWLNDDDVTFNQPTNNLPDEWFSNADLIILPLRMQAFHSIPTLLDQLQIAEFAAIQEITKQTALKNHPILCNGANLIVKKNIWKESFNYLHPEIASGDDMFLLEYCKKTRKNITYRNEKLVQGTTLSTPNGTSLFSQRQRWAGKSILFKDKDIRNIGLIILFANFLQILFPPFILIKFWPEYCLIRKQNASISIWIILLLELLYPYYMFFCLISGVAKLSKTKKETSF